MLPRDALFFPSGIKCAAIVLRAWLQLAELADVQAKTLRLEADGLNKPAPPADTEPASSAKKQRTVATQTERV